MAQPQVPFLSVARATQELRSEILEALGRVVDRGWYVLGEETAEFERRFAEYTGASHAVGVGNGLDAIALCLRALGVGAGHEVIVPANTFVATWIAVAQAGATPVGVEPIPGTWNIDPNRIEKAITPRTRAIVPVHLYGQPADLDAVQDIAARRDLFVVEDAAQAQGSRYRGQRIGAHGHAVAWSFYPGKNLGALGDGGAVTTNDADLARRVRALGNYGSERKYVHDLLGQNSRLDDIQAAALAVKLRRLDEWNGRRRSVAAKYLDALAGVPDLSLPAIADDVEHVFHLFVIDHPRRDALQQHLAAAGVQTQIHYPIPPHLSGAFANLGLRAGAFPVTERACQTHLSLPIGPHVTGDEVAHVIGAVRSFFDAR